MAILKTPPNEPTSNSVDNVSNGQYVAMGPNSGVGRWIHLTWAGNNVDLRAIKQPNRPGLNNDSRYHLSGRNYNSVYLWVEPENQLWIRRSSAGSTEIAISVYENETNLHPEIVFE